MAERSVGTGPRAFVVGHPIAHSRSPLIHGHWLAEHGLAGSYGRIDVAPDRFARFVEEVRAGAYAGGNITIPHKEAAFRLCPRVTDAARRLGAVNTLIATPDGLLGDNTDGLGFLRSLEDELGHAWLGPTTQVLVLGSGGAARAVVGVLAARVGLIRVANRTADRAADLAEAMAGAGAPIETVGWERIPDLLPETTLLVNTTSLGMNGQDPIHLPLGKMPTGGAVSDLVYVPLETELLAQARRAGLAAIDGLGMLLHQAVPGFEAWFGVRPRVTGELRALVEADLAKSHA